MPSRLRRALRHIACACGLGGVFVSALGAGALLHLQLPASRRAVAHLTEEALRATFEGDFEVEGVEKIGLSGVRLGLVSIRDPAGVEVIRAQGVEAETSVPAIVRSALGGGALTIDIPVVTIDRADVRVEPNAQGKISIAAAFVPRPKPEPERPGREVRVSLAQVQIRSGHVVGKPDGQRPLDADVSKLWGSVKVAPGLVAVDVNQAAVVERALLPGPLAGEAEYHLRVRGKKSKEEEGPLGTRMWAKLAGQVGQVPLAVRGALGGGHVELSVDVTSAAPEHVRALVPSYPLTDVADAHARVEGDFSKLKVRLDATTARHGSAAAEGVIELAPALRADLTFRTESLDPQVVRPALPSVRITSKGKVHAEVGALVSVRAEVVTEPTSLGAHAVPAIEATTIFDGLSWTGTLSAHEPGATVRGRFATRNDGAVTFEVKASAPSLGRVPRLRRALGGAAAVEASGVVRAGELDAKVAGDVRQLRAPGGLVVGSGRVTGRVYGPFDRLESDLAITATDAVAGGYGVLSAKVRVAGPIARPFVRANVLDHHDTRIEAAATVDPQLGTASRVKLRMTREGTTAEGEIRQVRVAGGRLAIDGARIEGANVGKINGSLRVERGELIGSLAAEGVDLEAVRKLLGLPFPIGGKLDADVTLAPAKGGRTGHVRLALREGTTLLASGISAEIAAQLEGDRILVSGSASLPGASRGCEKTIASIRFATQQGRLSGPLLAPPTWQGAAFRAEIATGDLDLGCLAALVPVGLPVSEISGQLAAKMTIERQEGDPLPSIRHVSARTHYLTIVGPEPAEGAPWASRDLDFTIEGDLDSRTGETRLSVQAFDEVLFGEATFSATLDVPKMLDPAARWASIEAAPMTGVLRVPTRPIARLKTLPTFVTDKLPELSGEGALEAYFVGSIAAPRAVVRARGHRVALGPDRRGLASPWAVPIDADVLAYYDGASATLDARVSRNGSQVLKVGAQIDAPIQKVRARAEPSTYLGGRAAVELVALPLGDVPAFGDRGVGGHVSGKIALDALDSAPAIEVDLRSDDLTAGTGVAYKRARFTVSTRRTAGSADATAIAEAHFQDPSGGAFDAAGYVQLDWSARQVPKVRLDRPADLHARFTGFRLASLEPFLFGAVRKLDGRLDGGARVGWTRIEDTEKGAITADLKIRDGTLYLPQIGQQLRLSSAKGGAVHLRADRDRVTLDDLVAEAGTGRARISASAELSGLVLKGAQVKVGIAESEALPIALEGTSVGQVWGALETSLENRDNELAVDVRSSDAHFKLSSTSLRDTQELRAHSDVRLSHAVGAVEQSAPPPSRPIALALHLSRAIVEGPGIYIVLSSEPGSPPVFVLAERRRAKGTLRLQSGHVEQANRKFVLDQGTIRFREEEPSNPVVHVLAHWDAPDGSRVTLEYAGAATPLSRDKLRLRSNPPRTEQQIFALLLLGSDTAVDLGANAAASTSSAADPTLGQTVGTAAVDLGGDLAAQQLNTFIEGLTPLRGLSTQFTLGESGAIQAGLRYQLGDTVSALATYDGGTPGNASTSDTSAAASGSLTLDWRFYRNWLLRAKVGARDDETSADRFTGTVEVLWQYRY